MQSTQNRKRPRSKLGNYVEKDEQPTGPDHDDEKEFNIQLEEKEEEPSKKQKSADVEPQTPTETPTPFIKIYDGAVSGGLCAELITLFESRDAVGELEREDTCYSLGTHLQLPNRFLSDIDTRELLERVTKSIQEAFSDYAYKVMYPSAHHYYMQVNEVDKLTLYKREVGAQAPYSNPVLGTCCARANNRQVSAILYLNTFNSSNSGQTYFPIFGKEIEAKRGRLVLFPSNFAFSFQQVTPQEVPQYMLVTHLLYQNPNSS